MTVKLGDLLVKANVVTESQLKAALVEQQKWGGKLGDILVRMEFCSEEIVVKALSKQLSIQRADLDRLPPIPEQVLRKVPLQMANELDVLPIQLRDDGKTLVVALSDPLNLEIIDGLRATTGCKILPLIAGSSALARARSRLYHGEEDFDSSGQDAFKITDAAGHTIIKNIKDLQAAALKANPIASAPPPEAPPVPVATYQPPAAPPPAAAPAAGQNPAEMLASLEAIQRKEVAALKAMVEILIEKGVFSRDEYLARVKR